MSKQEKGNFKPETVTHIPSKTHQGVYQTDAIYSTMYSQDDNGSQNGNKNERLFDVSDVFKRTTGWFARTINI